MRVVAMLSDSLSIVAMSSTVGKDEKSSGRWIHSATIRISTESAIEKARPISMRKAGIGRNSTARIKTKPSAKKTSRPFFATMPDGSGSLIAISFPNQQPPRTGQPLDGNPPSLREGGRVATGPGLGLAKRKAHASDHRHDPAAARQARTGKACDG